MQFKMLTTTIVFGCMKSTRMKALSRPTCRLLIFKCLKKPLRNGESTVFKVQLEAVKTCIRRTLSGGSLVQV